MRRPILFLLLVVLLFGCKSESMDRGKALEILENNKIYPRPVVYYIFKSDAEFAHRALKAGLEEKGLVTVKKIQRFSEIGNPLITFTKKATPFLLPATAKERKDNIQPVRMAEEVMGEITGIQLLEDDHKAIVEYTTHYINFTPFATLSKLKTTGSRRAIFSLYDDGWRLDQRR